MNHIKEHFVPAMSRFQEWHMMSTAENTYQSDMNNEGPLNHLESLSSPTAVEHHAAITGPVL